MAVLPGVPPGVAGRRRPSWAWRRARLRRAAITLPWRAIQHFFLAWYGGTCTAAVLPFSRPAGISIQYLGADYDRGFAAHFHLFFSLT